MVSKLDQETDIITPKRFTGHLKMYQHSWGLKVIKHNAYCRLP